MMKIAFSSALCPQAALETIVAWATQFGFDAVELRGLQGYDRLPLIPALSEHSDDVRELFARNKVTLLGLGAPVTLDGKSESDVAAAKAEIAGFVGLASRLGCPYVRIPMGRVQRLDNRRLALGRIAAAVTSLVPELAAAGVTLLVENSGDFRGSRDVWFVTDAASHPAVRCCWNQLHALCDYERPTVSIPRIGQKLGLVHVGDVAFEAEGNGAGYRPLGQGEAELARQIELLRGIGYEGYLILDRPEYPLADLPAPEVELQAAAGFLREQINARQTVLAAYKGDKKPTKFRSRRASTVAEG
ncbi:MAG TPA: sugar phosphate isomerase/epimerase family protein [Phycisphaerae bacterium]|nr:sugar phosphate isomerase/epimerase family protein [Phycisphaerae bacterium]HNU45182.1 sugar phosphate isomerase/epimerase family protein [Phycisphaerae bacterium]